ncbi:MAG: ATP-binding protein [Proteobacteria bacterium]|nr:ATP-binding protein [Pseudomonadota bacterium]
MNNSQAYISLNRTLAESRILDGRFYEGGDSGITLFDAIQQNCFLLCGNGGVGKTIELRNLENHSENEGIPTLYQTARDILQTGEFLIDTEKRNQILQWKRTKSDLILIVDAIDEGYHGEGYRIVTRLFNIIEKELGTLSRVRWILSCRPASLVYFYNEAGLDRYNLFRSNRPSMDDSGSDQIRSTPIYSLLNLSTDQIKLYVDTLIPSDSNSFLQQIEKQDLWHLAIIPRNLNNLIRYYHRNGRLGSYSEVMEEIVPLVAAGQNIELSKLSKHNAISGMQSLAVACLLCKKELIKYDTDDLSDDLLSPDWVLYDWYSSQVKDLLNGSDLLEAEFLNITSFIDRDAKEFLAAQWFIELLKGQIDESRILSLFTKEEKGEIFLNPYLETVAAWIAQKDRSFFKHIIKIKPEAPVLFADSSLLGFDQKKELLTAYAEKRKTRSYRRTDVSVEQAKKFAHPKLGDHIGDLLAKYPTAHQVRSDLLLIAEQCRWGNLNEVCLGIVFSEKEESHTKYRAVRILDQLASYEQKEQLLNYCMTKFKTLSDDLTGALIDIVFPELMSIDQLIEIIGSKNKFSHTNVLSYSISEVYPKKTKPEDLPVLFRFFINLSTSNKKTTLSIRWKDDALFAVLKELVLRFKQSNLTINDLANCLISTEKIGRHRKIDNARKILIEGLGENAHELIFSLFEMKHPHNWVPYHYEHLIPPTFEDIPYFLERFSELNSSEQIENLARLIFIIGGQKDELVEKIKIAIKDQIDAYKNFCQWIKSQKEKQPWEIEHEERRLIEEAENREALEKEKQIIQGTIEEIRSGKHINNISFLLEKASSDSSTYLNTKLETLNIYGENVPEALYEGLQKLWRELEPKMPFESDKNRVSRNDILCINAFDLAVQRGFDWKPLNQNLIKKILTFGLHELNRLPGWYFMVALDFSEIFKNTILPQLQSEFSYTTEEDGNWVLGKLVSGPPTFRSMLSNVLWDLWQQQSPHLKDVAEHLMSIMLSFKEDYPSLRDKFKNEFSNAIEENEVAYVWLKGWLAIEPATAWAKIVSLTSAHDNEKEFAVELIAEFSDSYKQQLLSSLPTFVLKDVIKYVCKYIRPEEDNKYDGAYSPTKRDDAADFRYAILKELEQRVTDVGLDAANDLLSDPAVDHMKVSLEYIRDNLKEKVDIFQPLTEQQIYRLSKSVVGPASSQYQFNEMILGRLSNIIRKTEKGDFSFKRTTNKLDQVSDKKLIKAVLENKVGLIGDQLNSAVKEISKAIMSGLNSLDEKDFQVWLADQLDVVGKGLYRISRESEVHNDKRTDIQVTDGRYKFVIEIKLIRKGGTKYNEELLRKALKKQLVEQYLIDGTDSGILVIFATYEKKFKVGNKHMQLDEMISELNQQARLIRMENPEIKFLAVRKILVDYK